MGINNKLGIPSDEREINTARRRRFLSHSIGLEEIKRIFRHKRLAIGGLFLFLVLASALFGPNWSKHDLRSMNLSMRLKAPLTSATVKADSDAKITYWLGTDHLGRDVATRLFFGARISLFIGMTSVIFAAFGGLLLGLLAGNFGGMIDGFIMRIVDLQLAFPFILLALVIVALLGPSLQNIILVFAVTSWPIYARTVRPMALSLREREFVEAARAAGAGPGRIIFKHILPNVASPLIVIASFEFAKMVIMEAAMGFLGLGVPPATPTWGNILADGRDYIRTAWWLSVFPGLAIMATATGINLLGDALRDILDPRLKYQH